MNERAAGGERWERGAIAALMLYYVGRLIFLALRLNPAIPPDETTHLGRVLAYATVSGLPTDGDATVSLGLVGSRPFLYYWLMARILALDVYGWDELLTLRLVNVTLGIAAAACAIGFSRRVFDSAWLRVAFFAAFTNTLMLTGLFASVHYDNLTNLLAVACSWAFVWLLQTRDPRALATLALCLALGALTKRAFLPLAAVFVLVWVVAAWRAMPKVLGKLWRDLRTRDRALRILCTLALVATLSAAGLYGGNLLRFGRLLPGLEQVVGAEPAMRNRIHARQFILDGIRDGKLDANQVQALIQRIDHPGDRRDLVNLLRRRRQSDGSRLDIARYGTTWALLMSRGVWGYYGHRRVIPPLWGLWPLWLSGGIGLVGLVATRGASPARCGRALAAVAGLYAAVLLFGVHRPVYLDTGDLQLAVQGRYLFPVLAPLYAAVAGGIAGLLRGPVGVVAVVAGATLIALADVPMLLALASEGWWTRP